MSPGRLAMIRTIAANCRATARQITGPAGEQLDSAADAIGELLGSIATARDEGRHAGEVEGLRRAALVTDGWRLTDSATATPFEDGQHDAASNIGQRIRSLAVRPVLGRVVPVGGEGAS